MNNAINYQQQIDELVNLKNPLKRSFGHGLNLKIYDSGNAVWIYRYTHRRKRKEILIGEAFVTANNLVKLSNCGKLKYEDALLKALEMRRDLKNDRIDPKVAAIKKAKPLETLNDVANHYFEKGSKKFKHPKIPIRLYDKYVKKTIGRFQIQDITPFMVIEILENVNKNGKPTISNDILLLLKSKIFKHALILRLITHSPAAELDNSYAGGEEFPRTRFLSQKEIEFVLPFFRSHCTQFSDSNYLAVILLLVFGCRKMELLSARWADIDFEKAEWLVHISKQKKQQKVSVINPIPRSVICIFEILRVLSNGSEFVFPSRKGTSNNGYVCENTLNAALNNMFGRKKTKTLKALPNLFLETDITHFVIHDLRRTCKTLMTANGISQFDSERCLNHKIKGIEGVYDRYDYFKERKEGFNIISNIIMPLAKIEKLSF
jgi:integrase